MQSGAPRAPARAGAPPSRAGAPPRRPARPPRGPPAAPPDLPSRRQAPAGRAEGRGLPRSLLPSPPPRCPGSTGAPALGGPGRREEGGQGHAEPARAGQGGPEPRSQGRPPHTHPSGLRLAGSVFIFGERGQGCGFRGARNFPAVPRPRPRPRGGERGPGEARGLAPRLACCTETCSSAPVRGPRRRSAPARRLPSARPLLGGALPPGMRASVLPGTRGAPPSRPHGLLARRLPSRLPPFRPGRSVPS